MATTQYIGARYVPLFADPAEWDSARQYEPLTIVLHEGSSYTSRQYVPAGIEITNEKFWALTGNYNAQVEQYRQEVKSFDGRITTNANSISAEVNDRKAADTALSQNLSNKIEANKTQIEANKTQIETNKTQIEANKTQIEANKTQIEANKTQIEANKTQIDALKISCSHLKDRYCVLFGDSWLASYPYVENFLKQSNYYAKVFNFSVGGAGASTDVEGNKFSTQVDNATASTDFDNSEIDDVIVVGGTNDVFYWSYWSDDIVQRSYNDFWPKLRKAFPKSNIHYFPDNARTMNGGYSYRYNWILESAQLNGICTHAKTLDLLALEAINDGYIGDDQVGVQHLNQTGYTHLAKYILSTVQGAEPMLKSQTIYYSQTYPVNIGAVVMADSLPAEFPEHPVANQKLTYADGRFNLSFNLTLSSFKHLSTHGLFIKTGPISNRIGANERPFYIDASRQPKIVAAQYNSVTGFMSTVEVNKAATWDGSCSSYEYFTPLVCSAISDTGTDGITIPEVILPLTTLPEIDYTK